MRKFRVFVSSPRDVGSERALASAVVERLRFEFRGVVDLEPVFWEQMPMRATDTFQAQIPQSADVDICVFILWSWFGTPLPETFRRPDGTRYSSGTEFEFECAVEAHRRNGSPDILVYRKTAEPRAAIRSREQIMEQLAQRDSVQSFIERYFRGEGGSFKAAFREFETTHEFEDMLETHLRGLVREKLDSMETGPDGAARWTESPFRGLEPFDVDHALIFCGRTRPTTEIIEALQRQAQAAGPFVMLVGTSGSGKSSLARAGVLPLLTQPRVIEDVIAWRRGVMRPGGHEGGPMLALASLLLDDGGVPELVGAGLDSPKLAGMLRDAPTAVMPMLGMALDRVAERARLSNPDRVQPGRAALAIVVDQFEEIFAPSVTPQDRDAFVLALAALARSRHVWIVGTLRSDFYPQCGALPAAFGDLLRGDGLHEVRPPRPAEIGQMIRRPALMAGLIFERRHEVEEGLDDVLRDAATESPSSLPLLQFALDELYKRRAGRMLRFADYEALGGLSGALRHRAEEEYQSLPPQTQAALPIVLSSLVRVDFADGEEGRIAQRRAPREQLAGVPGAFALLDAFVAARLFVADRPEAGEVGETMVGVAHEALLREWPRAKDWIAQNAAHLRARARLVAAESLWRHGDRSTIGLLPAGRALDEAVALRDAGDVALPPDAREFIDASVAHAAARRRAKRVRFAAAAVVLLIAAAGGGLYYDLYMRPHVEYYGMAFGKRNGLWEPNGSPLTAEIVRHRNQAIRITRRGRIGPAVDLRVVNGHGECPQFHIVGTYFGPVTQGPLNIQRICRFAATVANGEAVDERAYDRVDQLVLTFVYSGGATQAGAYFSPSGTILPLAGSGASRLEFTRYTEGRDKGRDREVRFLNAFGRPQPDAEGTYGFALDYDEQGRIARRRFIDADGKTILSRGGIAATRFLYDDRGQTTEERTEDVDGKIVASAYGVAIVRSSYDEWGNVSRLTYFDENDKPVRNTMGVARIDVTYDEQGDIVSRDFYDSHGNRVRSTPVDMFGNRLRNLGPDGFATQRYRYDEKGRTIWVGFFDENGKPVRFGLSFQTKYTYDETGNVASISFLDGEGAAIRTPGSSVVRQEYQYDSRGYVTRHTYYDVRGHKVRGSDGAAQVDTARDDYGRERSTIFFDAEGKPMIASGGFAEVRYAYDDRGNQTEIVDYDLEGHIVIGPGGWARLENTYDDHGFLIRRSAFGPDGQPIRVREGYASILQVNDGAGHPIRLSFVTETGLPRSSDRGCASFEYAYDQRGRQTRRQCLSADGAKMNEANGVSSETSTYDSHGRQTSHRFFDADGRPTRGPSGVAVEQFTFDDEGNFIEARFFDENGTPARGTYRCAHLQWTVDGGHRSAGQCAPS